MKEVMCMWYVAFNHTFCVAEYDVATREEAYRRAIEEIFNDFPNGIIGKDRMTGIVREYSADEMIEEIWQEN